MESGIDLTSLLEQLYHKCSMIELDLKYFFLKSGSFSGRSCFKQRQESSDTSNDRTEGSDETFPLSAAA